MSTEKLNEAFQLYKDAVTDDELVGAVVVVAKDDQVLLHEAVGMRDIEKSLPMEKDSLFFMASNGKAVVAAAAMILVDRSQLRLDDLVYKYIPSFNHGLASHIRIEHLLNHTSGFRLQSPFIVPRVEKIEKFSMLSDLQFEATRLGELGPEFMPGETYSYLNAGYTTLGAVIEIVSGRALDDFLQEEIHKPVGANQSYYYKEDVDLSDCVTAYEKHDGKWIAKNGLLDLPVIHPGGALICPPLDYLYFCQMFLNGGTFNGNQILSKRGIEQSVSNGFPTDYPFPEPPILIERGIIPRWYYRRSKGAYDGLPHPQCLGLDASYGYGWTLSEDGSYSHGGYLGTFAWVDPKKGLIGMLLTGSVGGHDPGIDFMNSVNSCF